MVESTEQVVRALQAYADRGIFRGFGARAQAGGGAELRFIWLHERPFVVRFRPESDTLSFVDLLPDIPYRSDMDRALRRWVAARCAPSLPEHRRIDPQRLLPRCHNRRGSITLSLDLLDRDYAHGVRKAVSLVNEVFFGFLSGPYEAYMIRNFHVPEE